MGDAVTLAEYIENTWTSDLATLRRNGWTVAVHNDYRLKDRPYTFWLFTNEKTREYVKGEGETDAESVWKCVCLAKLDMAPTVCRSCQGSIDHYGDGTTAYCHPCNIHYAKGLRFRANCTLVHVHDHRCLVEI